MRASVIALALLLHGCAGAPITLTDGGWQKENTEKQEHCMRFTMRMINGATGITAWLIDDIYFDCLMANGVAI